MRAAMRPGGVAVVWAWAAGSGSARASENAATAVPTRSVRIAPPFSPAQGDTDGARVSLSVPVPPRSSIRAGVCVILATVPVRVLHLTSEFPPRRFGGLATAMAGVTGGTARAGATVAVLLVEPQETAGVARVAAPAYGAARRLPRAPLQMEPTSPHDAV